MKIGVLKGLYPNASRLMPRLVGTKTLCLAHLRLKTSIITTKKTGVWLIVNKVTFKVYIIRAWDSSLVKILF